MSQTELSAPRTGVWVQVTTLALLVVLDLPFVGFLVRGNSLATQIESELLYWAAAALILLYVRFVERRPLTSIGLKRPTWKSVAFGLVTGVVTVAGMAFIYIVIFPALHLATNVAAFNAISKIPLWLNGAIIVRAAVFEETFYRGFAIERLTELTKVRWLGALIALVAFTYAHLSFWGWAHLIVAGFGGLIFTALYLWRRDLASNMIAHFFTDAVGLLLA